MDLTSTTTTTGGRTSGETTQAGNNKLKKLERRRDSDGVGALEPWRREAAAERAKDKEQQAVRHQAGSTPSRRGKSEGIDDTRVEVEVEKLEKNRAAAV